MYGLYTLTKSCQKILILFQMDGLFKFLYNFSSVNKYIIKIMSFSSVYLVLMYLNFKICNSIYRTRVKVLKT